MFPALVAAMGLTLYSGPLSVGGINFGGLHESGKPIFGEYPVFFGIPRVYTNHITRAVITDESRTLST
jgi:hypothetical protein